MYRTRAIITRSWFETTLDYKPQILGPKIDEFACLVYKLSVILTALYTTHIVIAEWGQIYFAYFHLIIQTCCLGVFLQKYNEFYAG